MKARSAKTLIDGVLLATTMTYLLTGLGVTHYRWIETVTGGFLTKNLSFTIHESLLVPFVILLNLHLFFRPLTRRYLKTLKQRKQRQQTV